MYISTCTCTCIPNTLPTYVLNHVCTHLTMCMYLQSGSPYDMIWKFLPCLLILHRIDDADSPDQNGHQSWPKSWMIYFQQSWFQIPPWNIFSHNLTPFMLTPFMACPKRPLYFWQTQSCLVCISYPWLLNLDPLFLIFSMYPLLYPFMACPKISPYFWQRDIVVSSWSKWIII